MDLGAGGGLGKSVDELKIMISSQFILSINTSQPIDEMRWDTTRDENYRQGRKCPCIRRDAIIEISFPPIQLQPLPSSVGIRRIEFRRR